MTCALMISPLLGERSNEGSDEVPKRFGRRPWRKLIRNTSNGDSLLFEKSDGTYWISLWDEVDSSHNVTVSLGDVATNIKVFDPLSGTAASTNVTGGSSVTVKLTDHPLLVEITSSTTTPPTGPPSVTTGSGPDSLILNMAEDAYQGDAPVHGSSGRMTAWRGLHPDGPAIHWPHPDPSSTLGLCGRGLNY
jgi:hypothetical protein